MHNSNENAVLCFKRTQELQAVSGASASVVPGHGLCGEQFKSIWGRQQLWQLHGLHSIHIYRGKGWQVSSNNQHVGKPVTREGCDVWECLGKIPDKYPYLYMYLNYSIFLFHIPGIKYNLTPKSKHIMLPASS